MKNNKNINIKKTSFLDKKKVLIGGTAAIVAATPIIVTSSVLSSGDQKEYTFENKKFNSIDSIVDYVKKNSIKSNDFETWSLVESGKKRTFKSPSEMRNFIYDKYIAEEMYVSNKDISSYENEIGMINNSDFWNDVIKINNKDEVTNKLSKIIYQGINDSIITTSLDDAADSYFQTHSAYFFDGIYFKSKNELKTYLVNNYLPNNNVQYNTIIMQGPNGVCSAPINLSNPNDAKNMIDSFILNNSYSVLNYINQDTNESFLINDNNIDKVIDNVNLSDLSYMHVHSNEGESRYVVDNFDDWNLIGPYFYDGILDVGAFMNKDMWKKTNGVSRQTYISSKIDTMIGFFFSSIIIDQNGININESEENKVPPALFRTGLQYIDSSDPNQASISLDEWFLNQLGLWSKSLKNDVINANLSLMKGNKYNTFFKIPILYSFLLQRIINMKLDNKVYELITYYFGAVCDYIQDALETIVIDDSLLLGKDGKKFNMRDFFNIGNSEYDINTSVEYYLNEFKNNYPKLIAAMDAYLAAYNNLLLMGGLIPFTSHNHSYLIENGIMTENEYQSIIEKLTNIYLAYSQTTYEAILSVFMKNSTNPSVRKIAQLPSEEWDFELDKLKANHSDISIGILLKSVGMQNSQQHTIARSILNSEIRIYKETGFILNKGYLDMLYSKVSHLNKVEDFINFIIKNPSMDTYKVYLAFLLDLRWSVEIGTTFLDKNSLSSALSFSQALTNLLLFAFGTGAILNQSISKMHASSEIVNPYRSSRIDNRISHDAIPKPQNHPIWKMMEYGKTKTVDRKTSRMDKVPLVETDFELYAMPTTLAKKINNNPLNSPTEVIDRTFSFLSDYGWNENSVKINSIKRPISINLNADNNNSSQINNIIESLNADRVIDVDQISIGSDSSIISDGTIYAGIDEIDDNRSRIIFPLDEADSISNSNFRQRSVSIESNVEIPDFSPSSNDGIDNTTRRTKTSFDWNIRNRISGLNINSKLSSSWSSVKNVLSKVGSIMTPILGAGLVGLEIFFLAFEIFSETKTQDFYTYTNSDGTEWIWDGGLTVSKYMGLDVKTVQGIESMQLIEPVQITMPQIEEFYYYDGLKYYDSKELKKGVIKNILVNNDVGNNKSFSLRYTLSDINSTFVSLYNKNNLIDGVLTDMGIRINLDGTYDFSKINKNSQYISNASYVFEDGFVANNNDFVSIANQIINKIRPTLISLKPNVDSSGLINGTLSEFVLPDKYWENGTIIENTNKNLEYVIDNSANLIDPVTNEFLVMDESQAINEAKQKLHKRFIEEIKPFISSKMVLENNLLKNNKYSKVSSEWFTFKVYKTSINGVDKYFSSRDAAQNYIYTKMPYEKLISTSYTYKGNKFISDKEIKEWILNQV